MAEAGYRRRIVLSFALAITLLMSTFSIAVADIHINFSALSTFANIYSLLFGAAVSTLAEHERDAYAASKDKPLVEANGPITRSLSYPVLQFLNGTDYETVSEISEKLTWNTDGSVEISDNRANHYRLELDLRDASSFKLLQNDQKVVQQVVIKNRSQYQIIWTKVSDGASSEVHYKFSILGTTSDPSSISMKVVSQDNLLTDSARFISTKLVRAAPSLLNASLLASELANDTAGASSPAPSSLASSAPGIGLDWSDAIKSGYNMHFLPAISTVEIDISGTFNIDPVTVTTTSTAISPDTLIQYEGEKRVAKMDTRLFAFFYDGSNIQYKRSYDDGYTWGSTISLNTGIISSDYYRWTITTTTDGSPYIFVFYWKQDGVNTEFYVKRGLTSGPNETWTTSLLFSVANHSSCTNGTCASAVAANATNGDVFVAFKYLKSGNSNYFYRVLRTTDATTWTTSIAETTTSSTSRVSMGLTDLASGKMLFLYARSGSAEFVYRVFSGTSWGSAITTSGAGMQTNAIKQISVESDRTNVPYVAYLTAGISGTLKVAKWTNSGTTPTFETAESSLSHALPSISITSNATSSVIRIYSINNDKVFETKKDGTWKVPFNPFGTTFTSPNQLTAQISYPAALWLEGTAAPYNIRFSKDLPKITWTPTSLSIEAKPGALVQLNFTSSEDVAVLTVYESGSVAPYTKFQTGTLVDVPKNIIQPLRLVLQILPNATSGWHNGTVSLKAHKEIAPQSFNLNIFVPTITKTSISTSGGTIEYLATPSYSPYFPNTKDISIYLTFTNGTSRLVEIAYDSLFNATAGPSAPSTLSSQAETGPPFVDIAEYLWSFLNWAPDKAYAIDPSCTTWAERYDYITYPSEIQSTLGVASQTLNVDGGHPLVLRWDIRWKDVDIGHIDAISQDWVHDSWNDQTIDNLFNSVVTSDKKVILILSTHIPPDAVAATTFLSPDIGGSSAQFYPKFRDDADNFIRHVITYIQSKSGWVNRVQMWQIDNEPNLHPVFGFTILQGKTSTYGDWKNVASSFNMWLGSVRSLDPTRTTVINMYQSNKHPELPSSLFQDRIIAPYENLLLADSNIGQQVASKLDIMGFDIYPDKSIAPPLFGGSSLKMTNAFKDSLGQVKHQLQQAPSTFVGRWGLLELPAGDKNDGFFYNPTSSDVGQLIQTAMNQIQGKPPAVTAFFQLRASNPVNHEPFNYDQNYALIKDNGNGNGTVLAAYKSAIQQNVVQNCPPQGGSDLVVWYGGTLNGAGGDGAQRLMDNGLSVEVRNRPVGSLTGAKLVVISTPGLNQFSSSEVSAITTYVNGGGQVIFLADTDYAYCNPPSNCALVVTSNFGFEFRDNIPNGTIIPASGQSNHPIWTTPHPISSFTDWCCDGVVQIITDSHVKTLSILSGDNRATIVLNDNAAYNGGKVMGIGLNMLMGYTGADWSMFDNVMTFLLGRTIGGGGGFAPQSQSPPILANQTSAQ